MINHPSVYAILSFVPNTIIYDTGEADSASSVNIYDYAIKHKLNIEKANTHLPAIGIVGNYLNRHKITKYMFYDLIYMLDEYYNYKDLYTYYTEYNKNIRKKGYSKKYLTCFPPYSKHIKTNKAKGILVPSIFINVYGIPQDITTIGNNLTLLEISWYDYLIHNGTIDVHMRRYIPSAKDFHNDVPINMDRYKVNKVKDVIDEYCKEYPIYGDMCFSKKSTIMKEWFSEKQELLYNIKIDSYIKIQAGEDYLIINTETIRDYNEIVNRIHEISDITGIGDIQYTWSILKELKDTYLLVLKK